MEHVVRSLSFAFVDLVVAIAFLPLVLDIGKKAVTAAGVYVTVDLATAAGVCVTLGLATAVG